MVIVLENHEFGDVIGNAAAPTINALAGRYGSATRAFGTTHPSLPNYLELISGSTHGVTSDCTSCTASGPNLADQLDQKGIDWVALFEGMPSPCFTGASASNGYAKKHNPFVYFPALVANAKQCGRLQPASAFDAALTNPTPPAFIWLTPNLCNDGHDCGIDVADTWLKDTMARVQSSHWYAEGGAVVITWDEGTTSASCCQSAHGGHMPTLVVSERIPAGTRSDTPISHAGILRTIEDAYGLPHLGDAECSCSGNLHPLL
ncbi:MAG: phosphatidylinositol-3-phosphatase [Acidimicrobiaceae bacterium]|jgi:hypothetical protein|nr:phosphatidylinositol-3-phosphatase [Acidimicrobiaceae bacterium]